MRCIKKKSCFLLLTYGIHIHISFNVKDIGDDLKLGRSIIKKFQIGHSSTMIFVHK